MQVNGIEKMYDYVISNGLDGDVGQGYTECWSKEELFQAKNVNFDG